MASGGITRSTIREGTERAGGITKDAELITTLYFDEIPPRTYGVTVLENDFIKLTPESGTSDSLKKRYDGMLTVESDGNKWLLKFNPDAFVNPSSLKEKKTTQYFIA